MNHLIIKIEFIAHSYSGIRIGHNRQEELDWPPSPARIHEALLSAAFIGLPRSADEQEKVWAAFRWLESLHAPVILASGQDENLRTISRCAIPQNNPKGSRLQEHSILLAPTKKAVPLSDVQLEVIYQWDIEGEASNDHIEILKDAAARISYFGRGEDRAEVSLTVTDETPYLPLVRWSPDPSGDTKLWTVRLGTTDGLKKRHGTPVLPRETRSPAQRWMRLMPYSDDAPRPIQPVAKAIFQLFPDNDDPDQRPISCDAINGGLWRELFRRIICELAKNKNYWDNPELASELLTGHRTDNSCTPKPHLAVVPLPSLNATHKADGRIRRVALLGYVSPENVEHANAAIEIYETVFTALNGLITSCKKDDLSCLRLVRCDDSNDKIWWYFSGKSRTWISVIPVAISRKFNVPKFATDGNIFSENERRLKRDAELRALLRKSLEHILLPTEIIKSAHIEITNTPLIPHVERAERYRPPGEKSFLTHVRIDFPCSVRGPLLLGDRRYFGLGLFAPA